MSDDKKKLDLDQIEEADTATAETENAAEQDSEQPQPPEEAADCGPPGNELGAVYDIPVQLSAVLGKTTLPVSQLLRLGRGAVVELDRKVGEPIDILVNNRLVARGEVVILDDRLGVTMTEIIKSEA